MAVLDELEGEGGGLDRARAKTTGDRRDVEAVSEEGCEEVCVGVDAECTVEVLRGKLEREQG